jgi:hypothetical protein
MFGMLSYHGLNQWWMHMARCIKLSARSVLRYRARKSYWPFKLDSFWKDIGKLKALFAIPRVCKTTEYYMNKDFVHAKNERLYCSVKNDTIVNQIYHVVIGERKKNWCKFLFISTCLLKVNL